MKKSAFLPVKKLAVLVAVILAGIVSPISLSAQTNADITAFNFTLNPNYDSTINPADTSITVPVYNTANVTALTAVFTASAGATVKIGSVTQVSGTTVNNFSTQVIYTVTNGTVTKNWKVNIGRRAVSLEKQLIAFSFASIQGAVGNVDPVNYTVSVHIPYTLDATALVATFTLSPLAKAYVGGVLQTSAVSANNFTSPVAYTIQAENGSTRIYTVSIVRSPRETGKQLLTFGFNGLNPQVAGIIDETGHTVSVTVPFATNLTNLVATFTASFMATVKIGTTIQVSGTTQNDFTVAKTFTVVAEDGATQDYVVTVSKIPASTLKDFVTFKFTNLTPNVNGTIATVDATHGTIAATIPWSANITTLVVTFDASPLVQSVKIGTVGQVSGTTINDFTSQKTYVITAEDGSTKEYLVTVSKTPAATGNVITAFNFATQFDPDIIGTIDPVNFTITLTVPFSQNVTALVPTFTSSALSTVTSGSVGNEISLSSGVTPLNFSTPVLINCRAEDGSKNIYTASIVRSPASTLNQLLTFTFNALDADPDIDATGVIDEGNKTVTIHVPFATPITVLVATFTVSPMATVRIGGTSPTTGILQTSGTTITNFTNPVPYRVYAENGSVEIYTVTVVVDANTEKKILSFSFAGLTPPVNGTVDEGNHTIQVNIPGSVSRSSLVASFTLSTHATVTLDGIAQISGTTANDFTSVRNYTVKAQDNSLQVYQVTVTNNPLESAKQLISFAFGGLNPVVTCTIDETAKTVTAVLPFGTNRAALIATYQTSSPLTQVKVGTVVQVNGVTPNNFTAPVVYTLVAENATTVDYTVTITNNPGSSAKDITYFAFEDLNPDVVCSISQTTQIITGTVPNGTNRAALRAFYTHSPLSTVRVQGQGLQQSGVTVNDFRTPLVYEVTAQDGTVRNYTVTIFETADTTKPVVTNAAQAVSNLAGQFVLLRSNEATGKLYLIRNTVTQNTVADLEAAVAANAGRSTFVSAANTDTPISTYNLSDGTYNTYAIDAAGNKSLRGANQITILDRTAPQVSVAAQTISNAMNHTVDVTCSENNGFVYLIQEGVPQLSKSQLDAAVVAKKGARGLVWTANVPVALSVFELIPGSYHAYAVDLSGNLSNASANIVVITQASRLKSILAYSFNGLSPAAIGQIAGTEISVRVRVGTDVRALVGSFTLSPVSKAYVGLVEQISGVTPNDFTLPVIYTVEAEDGTTLDYTVTVSFNTGIGDEEWFSSIKSYPNPFTDRLTLEMAQPADRIQVINSLGQTVADLRNPGETTVELQTGSWLRGIYFVRFYRDDKYVGVQKLIRE